MKRAMGVADRLNLWCAPAPVADYTPYRTAAIERVHLMKDVLWEYLGLVLYRIYGYI